MIVMPALAHIEGYPLSHPWNLWAERQVDDAGRSCCGAGDAQVLETDQWRMTAKGQYQVYLVGRWRDVEARMWLRNASNDPNPVGQAVVWWNRATYEQWATHGGSGDFGVFVYCFSPGELM
jgi:hypothetical protein